MHRLQSGFRHVCCTALVALTCSFGCEQRDDSALPARGEPSPNASILPAPLVSARELLPERTSAAPAERLTKPKSKLLSEVAEPKNLNVLEPLSDEGPAVQETATWLLKAHFAWPWLSAQAGNGWRLAELKRLAQRSSFDVEIELRAVGRMRWLVVGGALPLEPGTELRSRVDYAGHVLCWPDQTSHRLLPPGSLRSLFLEGRADATPLNRGTVQALPTRAERFGSVAETSRLTTKIGDVEIEQVRADAGLGGVLLCRWMLDLMATELSAELCRAGLIPVRAHYRESGQDMLFQVTDLQRRSEPQLKWLAVPPERSRVRAGALPLRRAAVLVPAEELRALKPAASEGEATVLVNHGSRLRYASLQGVPVAFLGPETSVTLPLPKGRYDFVWADFFGIRDAQPPAPAAIEAPARVELELSPEVRAVAR